MQAKFDEIMVPVTRELIVEDQQEYVVFDAFFGNTMFHRVRGPQPSGYADYPEPRATRSTPRRPA